jgi:hypothetical protein
MEISRAPKQELTISRRLRSTATTATSPGAYVRTSTGHRFNEIDDTNFPALGNGTVSVREALHEWIASQFVQRPHRGR